MIITPLGVSFHYSLYQKRKSLTPVVNYKIPRSLGTLGSGAVIFVGDTLLLPYLAFRVAQPTISHAVCSASVHECRAATQKLLPAIWLFRMKRKHLPDSNTPVILYGTHVRAKFLFAKQKPCQICNSPIFTTRGQSKFSTQ